ncbi:MAG: GxxExxY protein [Myxococcota bacterium]|nr:GxxExxY protein [Myxococcota bacterium]
MHENEITGAIVDAALRVHRGLGPGLLESVYETVLAYELARRGMSVAAQVSIAIDYDTLHIPAAFRADLVVESCVLVELKSVKRVTDLHRKQALTYMRLMNIRVGLVLNFNELLMRDGIHRIANGAPD